MDPATVAALLALLQAVPNLIVAAEKVRAIASETDQAALDAALDAAKAACLGDVDKAIADLKVAAQD